MFTDMPNTIFNICHPEFTGCKPFSVPVGLRNKQLFAKIKRRVERDKSIEKLCAKLFLSMRKLRCWGADASVSVKPYDTTIVKTNCTPVKWQIIYFWLFFKVYAYLCSGIRAARFRRWRIAVLLPKVTHPLMSLCNVGSRSVVLVRLPVP